MAEEPEKAARTAAAPDDPPGKPKRRLEFLKGQFQIPDDFDTMFQQEVIRLFEGEPE
jgi:hypothetical protein